MRPDITASFAVYYFAASVIAILSSARLTRLFTQDTYPPVARMRSWWEDHVHRSKMHNDWSVLATCPYCASFWVTGAVVGWAGASIWFTGSIHWTWWLVNVVFAFAYAAAMVVVRDGE